MRILRGLASYPPELRPCVAALGVFDGIHLAQEGNKWVAERFLEAIEARR